MELRRAHAPGYVPPGSSPLGGEGGRQSGAGGTLYGGGRSFLALGTPVRDAIRVALAREAIAVPHRGQGRPTCGRPPAGEARVERAAHQSRGLAEDREQLVLGDVAELRATGRSSPARAPRPARGCRFRQRAAGRGALRRSRAPWSAARSLATIASMSGGSARMSGPRRRTLALVELEDRARSRGTASLSSRAGRARACPSRSLFFSRDLPAPPHAEVAAEDEPVLEVQEQVLADRLDLEQLAAVEPLRDAGDPGPRMRSLDVESLADERLEAARRAVKCVAFGHAARVCLRDGNGQAGRSRRGRLGPSSRSTGGSSGTTIRTSRCSERRSPWAPAWRPLGFAIHALNGAIFGARYHEIARRVRRDPRRLALELALLEHWRCFRPACSSIATTLLAASRRRALFTPALQASGPLFGVSPWPD